MTQEMTAARQIEEFLSNWPGENQPMREWFRQFYHQLSAMEGVRLSFVARPGVSYSLRPVHSNQRGRDKFAIVDVIDDDPAERWLSVCFYEDMITDPNGRGELIPGGLSGSDGYCFDMYDNNEELGQELLTRLIEAKEAAAAG